LCFQTIQMLGQSNLNPETVVANLEWVPKIQVHHPAWLFLFLFALLAIFAWVRLYYGNILMQTLQSSANYQVAARIFMDNSLLQKQLDNILYIFYFLSTGLMVYVVETRFHLFPYGFSGMKLYLFNLVFLAAIFLARLILFNLAGYLFNRIKIFREYLYNVFIYNKLTGVAVLPLLLFVIYTKGFIQEVFLWAALGTISVIFIMRLIRGIVFSFRKDVSIFYMFLYLCALELAPLALFYRWLEGIL
jgi:hypothetical protein